VASASAWNHDVRHQGGTTTIRMEAPRSFHRPSLFEPRTRKV
jgi:hypothetical protein